MPSLYCRCLTATVCFLGVSVAQAGPFPTGFAVFGGGDVTINDNVRGGMVGGNQNVTVGSFLTIDGAAGGGSLLNSLGGTTINGPVTFNGNVQTGGNTYNGAINAGGSVTLGAFFKSQGITANGDVSLAGASSVTGNILTGGNVTNSSAITGNVTANGTITNHGTISGTQTAHAGVPVNPATFAPVSLPAAANFTPGTTNVTGTANLAPGKYGAVEVTTFHTLTLSAGNYFLKSLQLDGSSNLQFDLSKGPINVFVQGDISGTAFTNLSVKAPGSSIFQPIFGSNNTPNPAVEALAADVFFETLGNVDNGNPFGSSLFGTIYAPNGNITDTASVIGSLVAGGTISVGSGTVFYVPLSSVPEPTSITLFGVAALGFAGHVWRRKRLA
jgi:filamentous hemagglutinin